MTRILRLLSIPLLLTLVLISQASIPVQALDRAGRLKVIPTVVQVWWIWEEGGKLRGTGMGSGTIISADGLILTNHHVAFPEEELDVKHLGIALTTRSDQPPQPAFLATVAADSPELDLTVLRVTYDLDLRPVQPDSLDLPYLSLGDSGILEVGDELNIFGYPGIGGDTLTFTKGVVSGFTLDAAIEGRAWVKTDTTIAGGNSGGTAVDENGNLVGVPTRAGAGGDTVTVDCRAVVDTNGDNRLDDKDSCIPIGGFLNALRPVNLAKPLFEAARYGLGTQEQNAPKKTATAPTGQGRFFNLQFAPDITESGQPSSLISSLPSGAASLYLFFDYENMTDGTPWEMRVQIDGEDQPDWGLPISEWNGGTSGTWWVGWAETSFPDGAYRLGFFVDGKLMAEATIQVGGRTEATPTFANIVFTEQKSDQGTPSETSKLFPEGVKRLYAYFDYSNMSPGIEWTRTWLLNDQVAATTTEEWKSGANGRFEIELNSSAGLDTGDWRLELAIDDKLIARGDFAVAGKPGGEPLFEPFVFAVDIDERSGEPADVGASFDSGVRTLYAFSDYSGMTDGLKSISRVYVNGEKVLDTPFEWSNEEYGGASGTWWNSVHAGGDPLPDGEYTQELIIEGQVVQRGSAVIGAPAKPTPPPSQTVSGMSVRGVVIDADTNRPIPNAFFIVLLPGISVDAFQWIDEEVYTLDETDRKGVYKLPLPLETGQCYSLIVGAEGYWPHSEDDVCIDPDSPAEVDVKIQLQKR